MLTDVPTAYMATVRRCDELICRVAGNRFDGVAKMIVAVNLFEKALGRDSPISQLGTSRDITKRERNTTYSSMILSKHENISSTSAADQSLYRVDSTTPRARELLTSDLSPPPIRLRDGLHESEGTGLLDGPDQNLPVIACFRGKEI